MQFPITSSLKPKRMTPPWVRRRRVLLLIAVIVFILPGILLVVARALSERNFSGHVEAIRAQGLPASPTELEQWRDERVSQDGAGPVAEGDETALALYIEAAEMLQPAHNQLTLSRMEEIMQQFEEENCLEAAAVVELGAHLAALSEALDLLCRAAALPPGRYVPDYAQGTQMEIPHAAGIRWNVRLLRMDAVHAALTHDAGRAYEALVAAMAVVRILDNEPTLIINLVRCACTGILFDTLREVLGRVVFNDEQLALLQQWFAHAYIPNAFSNALIAERVLGITTYQNPALLAKEDERWAREEHAASVIEVATALGFYIREWDHYFTVMEELIAALRLPYPEAQAACKRLVDRRLIRNPPGRSRREYHRPPLPGLTKTLYSFVRLPEADARDKARSSLGMTAAAMERYRLAAGDFPETLQALVPKYLPAVPQDPIDLKPMRYRCGEEQCVVYSIGTNGVDNGGISVPVINEGDLTFTLRRHVDNSILQNIK